MPGILVVGEVLADGTLSKLSTEVATLARRLGEAGGRPVVGTLAGRSDEAATELARFTGGRVVRVDTAGTAEGQPAASVMTQVALAHTDDVEYVLLPASPNGRDAAGILSAVSGRGVLANATAVSWSDDGPIVEMSAFGGKLITESAFTDGQGIITVRPNALSAEVATQAGSVESGAGSGGTSLPEVRIVDRVDQATAAVSIDDARIIVAGGRGVGGQEGFKLIEDLAEALGGAVGATRAAVDSGWIPYGQQVGQTGKIVKPQLYLALGISGAIQHKVGMQTSATIVAINRDPDSPIADFADLFVLGDLFEVGPALLAELRARPD